jgi:hypothetical protein
MNKKFVLRKCCLAGLLSTAGAFTIHHPVPSNTKSTACAAAIATDSDTISMLGGDFAGLVATFCPSDGSFIPIPIYLIPKDLIEWGQEPKCLEILVSEDFANNGEDMVRNTITILPAAGCAVDNLETTKVTDDIDLSSEWRQNTNTVGLQYSTSDEDLRVETIFGLDNGHRMRVAIDLIPADDVFAVQSPMLIAKERRTSASSSGGTIADGGGLDGRTVSQLLGETLRSSKTFVEEQPLEESYERDGIRFVSLPGSLSVAYGWTSDDDWVLQVGLMQSGVRRVVARQFRMEDNGELQFDVQSWQEEV